MTREEAIRELKADYCGNRIICELHPDQCNQEECEIWLAIKALETQPDGDVISRQTAINAITSHSGVVDKSVAKRILAQLPSAQPEIIMCNDCEHHRQNYAGDSWCGHPKGLDGFELMPTDFCSAAERRTNERKTE